MTGVSDVLDVRVRPERVAGAEVACAAFDATGALLSANAAFAAAPGLLGSDGRRLAPAVLDALRPDDADSGRHARVALTTDDGERVYDLFVLPTAADPAAGPGAAPTRLLVAHDRTYESGLRNALTESRARYKDLVEIASDHAFEAAADGTFTFIAPQGLLGHEARTLIGLPSDRLLDRTRHLDPVNPFAAPVPVEGALVHVRDAAEAARCLEVTAVPLFDRDGTWIATRGVCRDVTDERRQAAEAAEARARDRVLGRIVRLFQREVKPENMVRAAASAITHGMAATGCQILGLAAPLAKVIDHPTFHQEAAFGRVGPERDAARLIAALEAAERDAVAGDLAGERHLLGTLVTHGDRVNGAIVVWREPERPDFGEPERRLLLSVAGHIGVALEQLTSHRILVDVSRTDGLTGLLNRRAFYEDMQRRIRRLQRSGMKAALMYVDLDNFKAVNDTWGHERGDHVLKDVADLLRANTRSTDMVSRLGGDEFAVWLDDADEAVAIKRAEVFLAASAILRSHSAAPDKPLMLSIGIAIHDARYGEDMNEFVSRADGAMYEIKRRGKGTYGVAAPPMRA